MLALARSLLLASVLVALGSGCDALGYQPPDSGSLAPGTFEFRAGGQTYTGEAFAYLWLDRPFEASVVMSTGPSCSPYSVLRSNHLLSEEERLAQRYPEGERVDFGDCSRTYSGKEGRLTIDERGEGFVRGTFAFSATSGTGFGVIETSKSTRVEGSFYALVRPDPELDY